MARYSKEFKAEALKLSDELGVKKAARSQGFRIIRWQIGETTASTQSLSLN